MSEPGETVIKRIVAMGRAERLQDRGFALVLIGFVLVAGLVVARAWPPPALTDTTQDLQ